MSKFIRWCRTQQPRPASLASEKGGIATRLATRLVLPDGSYLVYCEFNSEQTMVAAQSIGGITMLPSLSTPASRLSVGVRTWLVNHGVTVQPGDTVLNVLRALRNKIGKQDDFDISLRE